MHEFERRLPALTQYHWRSAKITRRVGTREYDLLAMSSYSLAAWWCCRARCRVSHNSVSALMHSYGGVGWWRVSEFL